MALMGLAANAQTWTPISQHVTGTDFLTGETVSTQEIMVDSGKALLIDYSATWCSWCWVMHQNGVLEAVQESLGDQVQVIWVEADPSTTNPAEITGTGSTRGDWTNGGTVPYPIINDYNFTNITGGTSSVDGYPTVVFISSTGYWCSVYGTDWGFGPYSGSEAVTAITNLIANSPKPGDLMGIKCPAVGKINQPVTFIADYIPIEGATAEWTFQGGNPATATGDTVTSTFDVVGTYNVTLNLTSDAGSYTKNATITIMPYAYYMDFEDETECDNWTYIDADGDGRNWSLGYLRGQGAGHDGSNGLIGSASTYRNSSGQWVALTPDNWFFTDAIELPDNDNLTLTWFEKGQDGTYFAEKYRVYVATAPTIDAATEIGHYTTTKNWVKRAIPLGDYKGQTVYLGFRHYGSTDMFYLDIDDIAVSLEAVVGINSVSDITMSVYPNPASDKLSVKAEGLRQVDILDIAGRVVATSTTNTVDLTGISNGSYIVRVVTNEGTAIDRLSIVK